MTLTYISRSSDFYTFYVDIPLSLGCIIRKVSAEDIQPLDGMALAWNIRRMCPARHLFYIFFNPVFQLSTAKNEINLFHNHVLIVVPVTFAPAGAMTPSAEFLLQFRTTEKEVREKSRECHNHKPQPFPDPKRKRKPTNLNKQKPNKRTKSTKISYLFPKRGNRNTKRTEKHKNKMTHGKTYNKSPRRINHKATKSKTNTGTTALERSVEQTTGDLKHFYS